MGPGNSETRSISSRSGPYEPLKCDFFQFSSVVQSCLTLQPPYGLQHTRPPCPSAIPEFTQTHVHWVSDAIQPSHSLSSPSPSAFNLSQHQGFFLVSQFFVSGGQSTGVSASKSALSMNIQDFRMYWFDLLAVQGTLKSVPQHHSSKASVFWHSTFFMVQLSHPYMTPGKTIALTRWTFVGKVISLLFNMLSRLVITFLPMSKCILISWLQWPSAVIWKPPKINQPLFPMFPHLFAIKWWDRMPWSSFFECWALSQVFHSPLFSC